MMILLTTNFIKSIFFDFISEHYSLIVELHTESAQIQIKVLSYFLAVEKNKGVYPLLCQGGRVVKALDLRSNSQ